MKHYIILIFFFMFFSFSKNKSFSGKELASLNKKWLVYKTLSLNNNPWQTYVDNYVLDFTIENSFSLKYLGDSNIETVEYILDRSKGIIKSKKTKQILYQIIELSSERMILLDKKHNEKIMLYSLMEDLSLKKNSIRRILINKKWGSDKKSISFIEKKFLLYDEIETDFNVMIEYNNNEEEEVKGGWLLDIQKDLCLLELYSAGSNFKAIYQIYYLDNKILKAKGVDNNGKILLLDLKRNQN